MTTFLDRLHAAPLNKQYPDSFSCVPYMGLKHDVLSPDFPNDPDVVREHRVDVTYSVHFRCKDYQYDRALKNALRIVSDEVYENIRREAHIALSAIFSGDREQALDSIQSILKESGE